MQRSMLNLLLVGLALLIAVPAFAADTIKIGFNIPLTGDIPEVGEGSKKAAEMYLADINGNGLEDFVMFNPQEPGSPLRLGLNRGVLRGSGASLQAR